MIDMIKLINRNKKRFPFLCLFVPIVCCFLVGNSTGLLKGKEPTPKKTAFDKTKLFEDPGKTKPLANEMKRLPSFTPQEALKTFKLQKRFQLQLVAAEPLLSDPVDACFDENGRMYVAEMHGYPFSQEKNKLNPEGGGLKDAGIVRLLEDTNGDGTMDKSVIFADKISWPVSVCCYKGGLFVIAPSKLYYFKDTDGDGKADVREVIFSGFGRGNVQGIANNLKWSLDNKIAFVSGVNGGELKHRGKPLMKLGRFGLKFDPVTEKVERITGSSQFGMSFDDWGNRFICSNSNHIQHVVYPERYLKRNPYFAASNSVRSVAIEGAAAPVFRTSPPEPWRIVRTRRRAADPKYKRLPATELVPTGFFTSATSVTIYRGDAYPKEFWGNAFIGDVGSNLMHRKIITPNKATVSAKRAEENVEFLTSPDAWFRPVNYMNAPDGTLYILDLYRETIEHPHSIPEDIKKFLHYEAGRKMGRVYRLVPPHYKRKSVVKLGEMTSAQLVAQLESTNGWTRETAQRLLWEKQDKTIIPALQKIVTEGETALGKLHALWTLHGLNGLTSKVLITALKDQHAGVREHAIRLSEPFVKTSPQLATTILSMTNDSAYRVKLQLAWSLGEFPAEDSIQGLSILADKAGFDPDLKTAFMTSVGEVAGPVALRLAFPPLRHYTTRDDFSGAMKSRYLLLGDLAGILARQKDQSPTLALLAQVIKPETAMNTKAVVISSLAKGLARKRSSLSKLIATSPNKDVLTKQIKNLFQQAAEIAADEKKSAADRRAAISLLAFADHTLAVETLEELLTPATSTSLQIATINALAAQRGDDIAETLLEGWKGYSPQVRREVIDVLLSQQKRTKQLLNAVKEKVVRSSEIGRDKKQLLVNHLNAGVRDMAVKIFADEINTNRNKVVKAYQPALELTGDAKNGEKIFSKNCTVCHKVGDKGHQVGPDLASTKNKSPSDLLITILDPSREAQPTFTSYTVVTNRGIMHNGLIASETTNSITLRKAEGKVVTILRKDIDEIVSSGKSLMPEGLEKEVNKQQMADLIQFIRTIKAPKK